MRIVVDHDDKLDRAIRRRREKKIGGEEPADWNQALKSIENQAVVKFFQQELAAGCSNNVKYKHLRFSIGGRRRFVVAAKQRFARAWQDGRFDDEIEFWTARLGEQGKIQTKRSGRTLRFYLYDEAAFSKFKHAVMVELKRTDFHGGGDEDVDEVSKAAEQDLMPAVPSRPDAQPQKNLQLSLIPLNFVRPVTPKVAGLSPVAPAISINDLARASYSDCNFLAAQSCNFFALDGGALAATGARGKSMRLASFSEASAYSGRAGRAWRRIEIQAGFGIREREHGRVSHCETPGKRATFGWCSYSRRQLLANATIAASRVGS